MEARLTKASSLIALCCCLMTIQHQPGWATTNESKCPVAGSVYRPNPDDLGDDYVFRLTIKDTPVADDPMQWSEDWHFRLVDRHSGKDLAESVLRESCPTGGLCRIYRLGSNGEDFYSVVVELTDEMRQVPDFSAPKVIILPGFVDLDLRIGHELRANADLRGKVVWIRMSCGAER